MIVTFISQCEKKALPRTRRVLDAFANRIGDNTWQTVITEDGLLAVKKLLRKTASKSTAVSCHWIRSRSRSQLLWTVGRKGVFNGEGVVAVNRTGEDKQIKEKFSLNADVISLLANMAGFFHDIGKANDLFQAKLDTSSTGKLYEAYRHEWVSLRIFQAFVQGKTDREWLKDLANIDNNAEQRVMNQLEHLKDGLIKGLGSPFKEMPHVAQLVGWLIVSHHKLPQAPKDLRGDAPLDKINDWRDVIFEPRWNSPQCSKDEWGRSSIEKNWTFTKGTLFSSVHWQTQVSILAHKMLRCERIFSENWFYQNFTAHAARLSLMLADHYYSSNEPQIKRNPEWQDRNHNVYANTFINKHGNKEKKQKLDEHNIGVGVYAHKIANGLMDLKQELPSLSSNTSLSQPVSKEYKNDFGWQDSAYELAKQMANDTHQYGFFGINKASTGKGKTRANARIMYGLSEGKDCRFSIALGLRTLTLQTADSLTKDLKLNQEDLALLIGSQAVKELHEQNITETISLQEEHGSESIESMIEENVELVGGNSDYFGDFSEWIAHDSKIQKLIQSPILVSTIDYLMPACEGTRGGRQIAPMLRLLTSDIVLDEPDDFGLEDMPALCRLVNWAGMLGSRVLLSSATLPPPLVHSLFMAYQEGRKQYTQVNGEKGETGTVCCAWFDERGKHQSELIQTEESFKKYHTRFVDIRVKWLKKEGSSLRKAKIIPLSMDISKNKNPSEVISNTIRKSIEILHNNHSCELGSKNVSFGLVRMANINPLVHVSKNLLVMNAPENTVIHYCIYHSQFPLIQRSHVEKILDNALTRKDYALWKKKIESSGNSGKI